MKCPKCNSRAFVLDTRYRKTVSGMYRRYYCPCCGFRFTTQETYIKDYTKPTAKIKGVK